MAVTTEAQLPPKKDVMLALLERSSVFIHLDPRAEDVRVPPWFKKQPQLVLQVGLNMAVRIPDLSIEDDAVSCTLSFSRSPFFCYVPFRTVFALVGEDGKGMIWPNDVPKEVAAEQAARAAKEQAKARLRPAEAVPAASTGAGDPAAPSKAAAPRRSKGRGKAARRPSDETTTAGAGPVPERNEPEPAREARDAGDGARETRPQARPGRESKRPLPPYLRVVK